MQDSCQSKMIKFEAERRRYKIRSIVASAVARVISLALRAASSVFGPVAKNILAETGNRLYVDLDVTTPAGKFKVRCLNNMMVERARLTTLKEDETCAWIDGIPSGSVLWDIGANIGIFTLYAAVRKDIRVVAFEPQPGNYFVLMNTLVANKLCGDVDVFPIALFKESRIGELTHSHFAFGSANNVFGEAISQQTKGVEAPLRSACIGMTIDNFIEQFSVRPPEYIKLDVDGNEFDILNGARGGLNVVKEICIEFDERGDNSIQRLSQFLSEFGFVLTKCVNHADGVGNAIFVKKHATTG